MTKIYKSDIERNHNKEVSIYVIKSYGGVIYVGQSKDIKNRIASHIYSINNDNKKIPLHEYMYNNEYTFEIIDKCLYQDRLKVENKYIKLYSLNNFLYNKKLNKEESYD